MKNAFRVIAFMYKEDKLDVLEKVLAEHQSWINTQCDIVITTNTNKKSEINKIIEIGNRAGNINLQIQSFPNLPDHWLLPWAHKPLLLSAFHLKKYDYYIYSEDDILITNSNLEYFDYHRGVLKQLKLYPMFTRVEWSKKKYHWVYTDIKDRIQLDQKESVRSSNSEYIYYCPQNPYQAMLMYDNELMLEHINSKTFEIRLYAGVEHINSNPHHPGGGVAERAAFGLTFEGPIAPLTSRCLIPVHRHYNQIDVRAFVHHLGDAYADKHDTFGQVMTSDLVAHKEVLNITR